MPDNNTKELMGGVFADTLRFQKTSENQAVLQSNRMNAAWSREKREEAFQKVRSLNTNELRSFFIKTD